MARTNLDDLTVSTLTIGTNATAVGDQAVAGNLTVAGTSTLTGALDAKAATTLEGTLAVTGASTLTGAVDAKAAVHCETTLAVDGASTLTGAVDAKAAATLEGPVILTPQAVAALAVDVTKGACATKTIAGDSTFTASTAGTAGQMLILVITASAAQRTVTFGSNLNAASTMVIPSGKVGCIQFISDGSSFREIGRSINA